LTGAQAIARILKLEGVEQVFCFPLTPILEALADEDIRPIVARQERVAENMADGFSRASCGKRIGVVSVQDSAGAENGFAGIAQANTDSSPILFLPGHPGHDRVGVKPTFDAVENFRGVTKYASRISSVSAVSEHMRRAYTALRSGRPGPALVEIPRDVAIGELDGELEYQPVVPIRSAADPAAVREAVKILLAAERPLIRCGQGVIYAGATDELTEVAELLAAPVMTTLLGKSAFNESHALALGTGSLSEAGMVPDYLGRCDAILGIGTSLTKTIFGSVIPTGPKIIHATNDPADINKDCVATVGLVGDAKLVLAQFAEEIRSQTDGKGRAGLDDVKAYVASVKKPWLERWVALQTSNETPLNPYRVIKEFTNLTNAADTIVTHESGGSRDQLVPLYEAVTPRGYIGWGHSTQLGFSLGAAMGAKLACPEKLVVNFTGDTAFGMVGMDLETAVREEIPILTVLLNNSAMGNYDKHIPKASAKYGTRFTTGNYSEVAKGLGAYSERIAEPGDIRAALERGIRSTRDGRAALIEFITKEEPDIPYRKR